MSQQTLVTPIDMKNVTKIKPIRFVAFQDDDIPYCELTLEFKNNDGVLYNIFKLTAYNIFDSVGLIKNPAPSGYMDRILTAPLSISNAYTALKAADDGATGNRSAHLDAVLAAALAIGLVSADFAST